MNPVPGTGQTGKLNLVCRLDAIESAIYYLQRLHSITGVRVGLSSDILMFFVSPFVHRIVFS
jgi:hypothetical protein